MFKFENGRPAKQGTKYSLTLGQNEGPYLNKDIVATNRKSLKYLTSGLAKSTAHNILNSTSATQFHTNHHLSDPPQVYDDKLQSYTNYDEKYKSNLNAAENITNHSSVQSNLLRKLQDNLSDYKQLIREYREELRNMNEKINQANFENLRTIQPQQREFYQNLKVQLNEAKNENYQLQREADQLMRDKIHLQQQIAFCEKRTQDLEKFVGVEQKNVQNTSMMSDTIDFQ